MDFKDQLSQLATRVTKLLPQILTEEATKNALIMPFIQILGYDVFNPLEVNPEFIADLGIKKGEKVDYAIMKDGHPILLIECKHHLEKLDPHNSQLFRYFHTTKAKFGLLTNGLCYRFYTDLLEPNKMDEKPFFEFNIDEIKDNEIVELKKFHKSNFDVEKIVNTASELKYGSEIKTVLANEFKSPSPAFVKLFLSQVYDGMATKKVMDQFTDIVRRSLNQYVSDLINERLKAALDKEEKENVIVIDNPEILDAKPIDTTELEKEGFHIVKAILRKKVPLTRVFARDTQTYFGVLLDDNNRKPLCRLWLNGGKKYISIFDKDKKETKHELLQLEDIFNHSDQLLSTFESYEKVSVN